MAFVISYNQILEKRRKASLFLLLLAGAIILYPLKNFKPFHNNTKAGILLLRREGYDARTGKWINKRPSASSFSISPQEYEMVKNWFATDSGTNNPNQLPLMAPKDGYTYIYTPYKDAKHPFARGMSIQGQNGFKGYWYADDLSKATDSTDDNGNDIQIAPPKDKGPANVEFGGYDARTGNWVHTTPSIDAFSISFGTYERVKNWFNTDFNVNNPLFLPVEVPMENYTYLYVPYSDPKHPGVIGMSFQGDRACRGYWYADKIGATNDTIMAGKPQTPVQTADPSDGQSQQRTIQSANPPPAQNPPSSNQSAQPTSNTNQVMPPSEKEPPK